MEESESDTEENREEGKLTWEGVSKVSPEAILLSFKNILTLSNRRKLTTGYSGYPPLDHV